MASPLASPLAWPLRLLAVATIGLLAVQAAPRPGAPVMLVFPPGAAPAQALLGVLGVAGWDPVAVRRIGPVAVALAAPSGPAAPAGALRRASGAWLVMGAGWFGPCTGDAVARALND